MRVATVVAALLALSTAAAGAELVLPIDLDTLKSLSEALRDGRIPEPREQLLDAVTRSAAAGDSLSEAYARAGIAALEERAGQWRAADTHLREAAALAARAGDPQFLGRTTLWLAQESALGVRSDRTITWSEIAAAEFRAAGDRRNLALALRTAASMTAATADKRKLLQDALAAAREGGNPLDIAGIQADWGEALREAGDLTGAIQNLEAAIGALDQLGASNQAGRALTLLARTQISHSHHREALRHLERAESLLVKGGDTATLLTARLEMAWLLATGGDRKRAIETLDQVKVRLMNPDTPATLRLRLLLLAHGYLAAGKYDVAAEVANEVLRAFPRRILPATYWILSAAYFHLGRYQDSIDAATTGISRASDPEALANIPTYRWRGRSLDKLGRTEEAARDMLAVSRLGDAVLDRLVPEDEWKRLFTNARQEFADDVIAVLWRAGKRLDALQMAEKFRARAFLDLVASRDRQEPPAWSSSGSTEPRLASAVLSTPLSNAQLSTLALRTRTPVLSYWVHPEGLYIWLLTVSGELQSASVPLSEHRLDALVGRARSFQYKPDRDAWRELHKLLIQPVGHWLPRAGGGSLLTILPHGVLLQLPFAALLNPSGRYLVEDYSLCVSPAAGFLLQPPATRSSPFVLIGAPQDMPVDNAGKPLPPLPGALRELERIAALLPDDHRILRGAAVEAQRVRDEAAQAGVLHFATHAILDAERPFDSFLALSKREKLTAGRIYDLRMSADLVLLSACRGGSGRVSSDGLLGFARAFLYAGAGSVIAPLWDIPDEPTVRLVEEFYRQYRKGVGKSQALRAAQLKLLHDLRAGRVDVMTPAGSMALPEHPGLWAGFVLQGAN